MRHWRLELHDGKELALAIQFQLVALGIEVMLLAGWGCETDANQLGGFAAMFHIVPCIFTPRISAEAKKSGQRFNGVVRGVTSLYTEVYVSVWQKRPTCPATLLDAWLC
jgi:hypothetical protein